MNIKFWSRRKQEEELDEELRSHLQMAARERLKHGESPAEEAACVLPASRGQCFPALARASSALLQVTNETK